MIPVSLCVLTHNNTDGLYRLVDSIKEFPGLDVSIIVGDNSNDPRDKALIRNISDEYFEVPDSVLWDDGFGPSKQRIVSLARSNWVIIADPDEIWEPIGNSHIELLESGLSVFRTSMMQSQSVQHGRVFDRRKFRIIGLIHEELYGRKTREPWNLCAPDKPFALIQHFPDECSSEYIQRKKELYDQLIYRASKNRELHRGTNPWWFDTYLPKRISDGFTPMTFDEWQELGG